MEKLQNPKRIAIFRALHLGDLLCAVPALRALRAAYPLAEIILIGLPWSREFVLRFPDYLDDAIEFPGFPGFPEQNPRVECFPDFLIQVHQLKLDLTLQMQGSGGIANSLVMLFGARRSGGFYIPGQYCPDEELYVEYPVHEPEVIRHLRLMDHLGIQLHGSHLEFPLTMEDRNNFESLAHSLDITPGNFICIHPGARGLDRRWSLEKFAAVGDHLAQMGYRVVLTGSPAEAHLTQTVAAQMSYPAFDLSGQTTLGTLGVLLSQSRLLITNDTGVSHLADALSVPSIVLFSASDPNRWAPLDHNLHRAIAWASAAPPQVVIEEACEVLGGERQYVY